MSWNNSLFSCFDPLGSCCLATFCPCVLYGKTRARQEGDEDPSGCNCSCCGWCVLAQCGFAGFLQCMNRGTIRKQYQIKEGGGCTDCLVSFCCTCCALVQENKEVKEKQQLLPAGGFQKPDSMMYAQQP